MPKITGREVLVRVVKIPTGEAPEEHRRALVGLSFNAIFAGKYPEMEIIGRIPTPEREVYRVRGIDACGALARAEHYTAAGWFLAHTNNGHLVLCFGIDELEEVDLSHSR